MAGVTTITTDNVTLLAMTTPGVTTLINILGEQAKKCVLN